MLKWLKCKLLGHSTSECGITVCPYCGFGTWYGHKWCQECACKLGGTWVRRNDKYYCYGCYRELSDAVSDNT